MIILDATDKLLEFALGGAVTTDELDFIAAWADVTDTSLTEGNTNGTSNGAADVTAVAAPAADTQRVVRYLAICNTDTVDADVTVKLEDGADERVLQDGVTLGPGEVLQFTGERGWQVLDSASAAKTALNYVHTHASDAEGGQLDWDDVWSDAVHDHSAAGEGGQLETSAISTKTGADANVVTGTAGGANDLAIWNADGDAVEGAALGSSPLSGFDNLKQRFDANRGFQVITEEITYGGDEFTQNWIYIPPFEVTGISGVTFGGFLVGQYGSSQPNATADDDNPDVADNADASGVPATSKQGVSSWRYIDSLDAREAAVALGTGAHLITAFEWASLAYWALEYGYQPQGNNQNTDPPSDENGDEGLLDRAANARNSGWHPALTGSGPVTWALGQAASGVWDLNGNMWEWVDGLLLLPENLDDDSSTPHEITAAGEAGYCLILANLEVSLTEAPYGASTATAAGSLTDSNKAWTVDEFVGCWLYDAAGALYYIDSNTADTLSIDGSDTPATGPYTILQLKAVDITDGMSSGNRILTLQSDADLEPLAIPATSDATGSETYGNDGYWFSDTALRAARRGGNWYAGVRAGVFALNLNNAPGDSYGSIGLRVAKSL